MTDEADDGLNEEPAQPSTGRVPSPEATGGSGNTFEGRVAGITLARLLRGDQIEGLNLPVRQVRLQQRVAGALLDDVVVDGEEPSGDIRTIEYQVKRHLAPAPGDADFLEIIGRCLGALWAEMDEPYDPRTAAMPRRFGIAAGPSVPLADLARVTVIARSHDHALSFLRVAREASRAGVRQRLTQLRDTVSKLMTDPDDKLKPAPLEAKVDEATWRVAKALHVWVVDAEPDGRDVLAAQDRLADLLLGDAKAPDVFRLLVESAQAWAPQAATIDIGMLRSELERKGVASDSAPARRVAFEAFRTASVDVLDLRAARLGNRLTLPRTPIRREVVDTMTEHSVVMLTGRAGVGKSILGRLVADDLSTNGTVVLAINLAGRAGSLSSLEADLGIQLGDALAGAPIGSRRVLFIDGAEQALTDAGTLLLAVLKAIPLTAESGPQWQVLITARDEAADVVQAFVAAQAATTPKRVIVGELLDAEVRQVLDAFPALEPLERNARAKALLLRRPYLVELLIRSGAVGAVQRTLVGEEDLVDIVTARLVRRDEGGLPGRGAPDARSDIYLALAESAIENKLPASLEGRDAEARAGLRSDDVITAARLSWRFAHDVLVDYAVATRLLEPGAKELIMRAPAPRRLLRAVRLRMQRELADSLANQNLPAVWARLETEATELASSDGPRWRDVPWEALLNVGVAREVLPGLSSVLLENDAAGLMQLVDVAERRARRSTIDDRTEPLALETALTGPVVDLLASLAANVPAGARLRAARLVHAHLQAAFAFDGRPEVGLDLAAQLPAALLQWAGEETYGDTLEFCIGSLGFLGGELEPRQEEFLVGHASTRPDNVAEVIESPWASASLAQTRPALLLRLAGLYYLGIGLKVNGTTDDMGKRPRSRMAFTSPFGGDLDEELHVEGVRDHDSRQSRHLAMFPLGNNQANPALGPFAALLKSAPEEGMRLIGAVVDAATAARARLESGQTMDENPPALTLVYGDPAQSRSFVGPATVWCWHRRTSVGPGPAQSALMALRRWASDQISDGVDPSNVRDRILAVGTSLAFPAVAWFVLLEHLDVVEEQMDTFLSHPRVWSLENGRRVMESGGIALDVPEMTRLAWTVSDVAMQLVLRGDQERRNELATLSRELISNTSERGGDDEEMVVRRWASELDVANYVTEPHEQGVAISVGYASEVTAALASGGATAARALEGASLMRKAAALRDGDGDLGQAVAVWSEVVEHVKSGEPGMLYSRGDMLCAAAAGLLFAVVHGQTVEEETLREATAALLRGASEVAHLAPPDVEPPNDAESPDSDQEFEAPERFVREMFWDDGMDRSVATALPCLLANPDVRSSAGVSQEQVAAALEQVAASPYDETRNRLVRALLPLWECSCDDAEEAHRAIWTVARRLLATAGYGPIGRHGFGYPSATLAEPLEANFLGSSDHVIEVGSASFAVELLAAGAVLECPHGVASAALLDVLINYDERLWPEQYARHHYSRTNRWRRAIDSALAHRILRGDRSALISRLDAFAPVGEELVGLLNALVEHATGVETAAQLHAVWPEVLDRLLPSVRDLSTSGGNRRRDHPYHRDVEDLDGALLLLPPDGTDHWPWVETLQLGARWFREFAGHANMADRAITYAGKLFGLQSDLAVVLVLQVLGDNVAAIRRESQLAVPFLQFVLRNPPSDESGAKARVLLDGLAAAGDEFALKLQREFEGG